MRFRKAMDGVSKSILILKDMGIPEVKAQSTIDISTCEKQINTPSSGMAVRLKSHNQTATLLIMEGHIIITMDPKHTNIMEAIEELQLRDDELNKDFEPAIISLINLLLPRAD